MASRFGIVLKHATQALGQLRFIRKISSTGRDWPKNDIVPQLTYYDVKDKWMDHWMPSHEYADKRKFLYKPTIGRLIRQCDWEQNPRYMQAIPGIKVLKQSISLTAYNLRRGRNIGHLLTSENILLSESGNMMLKETDLPDMSEQEGPDKNHVAFRRLHDWYFGECGRTGLLARSMNEPLTDELLPPELIHLRGLLKNSALVDKRQITNHAAQMFPYERTQQVWTFCHFLRNEAVFEPGIHKQTAACTIYEELGRLIPGGLKGIHPMIDYWLEHAENLGKQIILSHGGETTPALNTSQVQYMGKLLVAAMRASVEHPFGPGIARFKKKKSEPNSEESELDKIVPISARYFFYEVEELRDFKLPMFCPTALSSFLSCNLDWEAGLPKASKDGHLRWNDVSTVILPHIYSKSSARGK